MFFCKTIKLKPNLSQYSFHPRRIDSTRVSSAIAAQFAHGSFAFSRNTMSSAFEALGLSLPFSSTMANVEDDIVASTRAAARIVCTALLPARGAADALCLPAAAATGC